MFKVYLCTVRGRGGRLAGEVEGGHDERDDGRHRQEEQIMLNLTPNLTQETNVFQKQTTRSEQITLNWVASLVVSILAEVALT